VAVAQRANKEKQYRNAGFAYKAMYALCVFDRAASLFHMKNAEPPVKVEYMQKN